MRIGFSGSLWNDVNYAHITAESKSDSDQNRWSTQTRGVLRVTPTYNAKNGWFAQGNAEFVLHGDMQPDPVTKTLGSTDDLFVRIGKWDVFDITVRPLPGLGNCESLRYGPRPEHARASRRVDHRR